MKKSILILPVVALLISAACSGNKEKTAVKDSTETAMLQPQTPHAEEFLSDDKLPVVVDFSAEWCPPCKAFAPIFHKAEEKYEGKVRFVSVDVDSLPDVAERYEITSIPTVLYIAPDGEIVNRTVGMLDESNFDREIRNLL